MMASVVVTVPKKLWSPWIQEGDAAGDPETGEEWGFYTFGANPTIEPGERVYIVAHGLLRGYAPLTRLVFTPFKGAKSQRAHGRVVFCRKGGAVACTLMAPGGQRKMPIRGFRGWQYAWFKDDAVVPFPEWKTEGVV